MVINLPLIDQRLKTIGTSWCDLQRSSSEIVLFGSAACGLANASSDVDILCVGTGNSRITDPIDLVWVASETIGESQWIGSELAGHIAKYGKWLKGTGEWTRSVSVSAHAVNKKQLQVAAHVQAAMRHWKVFNSRRRKRQLQLIRRQLQRLAKLVADIPVPATPILDKEWDLLREQALPEWNEVPAIEPEEIHFLSMELGLHRGKIDGSLHQWAKESRFLY